MEESLVRFAIFYLKRKNKKTIDNTQESGKGNKTTLKLANICLYLGIRSPHFFTIIIINQLIFLIIRT
jgi:hypothetical protein